MPAVNPLGGRHTMRRTLLMLFGFILCLLFSSYGPCAEKCVQTEGEAAIVGNDIPSAKTEAVARAKWTAIRINGVADLDTNQEIKGMLQQIVWVTEVEEKRMREFVVGYPENSLYLANSLRQKGRFKILDFTPYALILEWK
jgi:hypothetical protein